MAVQTIEYYEVGDAFDAEGKGPFTVIARITDEREAHSYAMNKGNYGRDAIVRKVTFVIVDYAHEIDALKREEKRQAALNKLTEDEKELLGLK